MVQLCVARNKRRRSAANYKGVAMVTTRSGALYRGLNFIDASEFRLDTLTTHAKHGTPTVAGKDVLITHTDYVNRYPSLLRLQKKCVQVL